ncbi:MAG: hypothetical protein NC408_01535 [Candidatus Gastranaerophilales bacterium]|nr:hypothetical protein [Candidatus Gastranaerophilales bacterium]MCM1072199.1 hypothetical protein [Bacteroides sp.]
MNIKSSDLNRTTPAKSQVVKSTQKDSSVKFADELKELKKKTEAEENVPAKSKEKDVKKKEQEPEKDLDKTLEELTSVVEELNQSDEKSSEELKTGDKLTDNTNKGENLINNDFNIQDNKDILPQMNPNMNFSGDGQPFSSFMGNENNNQNSNGGLSSSAADLAEEAAILSTMAENIAMANKNTLVQETAEKTVNREEGIKKVDVKSGITIENVVKYDSIIMNEADVEVFAALAETGEANLNNLAPESAQKSVQVSKTLADMLAKAKETQQPLRIDFDNGISVIIKISRDGKVSADFLPSTQIAEAYLKENLPLLKQRFDEKNLEYEELNRRERREQNKEDNQKKGRRNE